ncbi:MAG: DUF1501 domain-containing protein [Candidatus Sumerlaeaceae bacterium]
MSDMNRRQFIRKVGLSSLAYFTAEATTPNWIIRAAQAVPLSCLADGKILVILQQSGGNDGLNTVIPRTDPVYYDALTRPTIRVAAGSEINLTGPVGLHPRLAKVADWYNLGNVAIMQNVGYVNPDLSHFSSTDYWETGSVPGVVLPTQGWVARFYDNTCNGTGDPEALFMAATGMSTVPGAFENATGYTPPAVSSASSYNLTTNGSTAPSTTDRTIRLNGITALNSMTTTDPDIDFVQRSENTAEASITDIATASAMPDLVAPGSYTTDTFGTGMKLASQIIRAGFNTRIFYVSQGGYDTHADQINTADPLNAGDHPVLLSNLDKNLDAFLTEMQLSGNLDRVLVLTFSEFGRRVVENSSRGTDHGAANVMFALGGGVNGGVFGGQPDLVNLIKGNLTHQVDFRAVYSQVIENWFGAQASPVFGASAYNSLIAPDMIKVPFVGTPAAVREWKQYA